MNSTRPKNILLGPRVILKMEGHREDVLILSITIFLLLLFL